MKLEKEYYLEEDVVAIARDLIGKVLITSRNGIITQGIITETEAYNGVTDRASHAFGGKRTPRNEVMYHTGGIAYVYLCYGIHHLFNIVTNTDAIPHAVLVRGIIPFSSDDQQIMQERRGRETLTFRDNFGPGKVTQSMHIHTSDSGTDLTSGTIWVEDRGIFLNTRKLRSGPRIGVGYAKEDAALPYRFYFEGNNPY